MIAIEQLYLQSHHLHHEAAMVLLLHLLLEELGESLLQHQTHVVTLRHADTNTEERTVKPHRVQQTFVHSTFRVNTNSLFKKRKVDEELGNVDDILEAEVILTAEERIGTFGLEGNVEHLVTERQRV